MGGDGAGAKSGPAAGPKRRIWFPKIISLPSRLTSELSFFFTGMDSPVTMASLTELTPKMTVPSTGTV